MRHPAKLAVLLLHLVAGCTHEDIADILDYEEQEQESAQTLADRINEVRVAHGLTAIEVSPPLTAVAEAHIEDLAAFPPDQANGCNLHSWSQQAAGTPCCYTGPETKECMLQKPSEIAGYPDFAFEIAAEIHGVASSTIIVDAWLASPGHRSVILNEGKWAGHEWKALGVGLSSDHAAVWFGETVAE